MSGRPARKEGGGAGGLRETLDNGIGAMQVEVEARARVALVAYVEMLALWNRGFNLVGRATGPEMIRRHVLDSLSLLEWMDAKLGERARLLDLGTGAGVPGLVLAIARPAQRWTLLDSNGKRTRFCVQAAAELGAANVDVVQARVQDHRPATPYDAVVSRAVADVPAIAALSGPVLGRGGRVLAMAGRVGNRERGEWSRQGLDPQVVRLSVPGAGERHLVIVTPVADPADG